MENEAPFEALEILKKTATGGSQAARYFLSRISLLWPHGGSPNVIQRWEADPEDIQSLT